MEQQLSVFQINKAVIAEYAKYVSSFINIQRGDIASLIQQKVETGALWPEPLIHFNPAYKYDQTLESLVEAGTLHSELKTVFTGYKLYTHQVEAITHGVQDNDFIVTSGTGSGKSLTYIATILNYLFELKEKTQGIKAIIVYPMNALINSQTQEFNKFRDAYQQSGEDFPISYAQYTGQESQDKREEIKANPPDVILTNYMMLELILTRSNERALSDSIFKNLKYLVFDELHTYRGRRGADVAMLIRRIRAQAEQDLVCIGTSATMVAGIDTIDEQKAAVASVASLIFGKRFQNDQIITETLAPSLNGSVTEARSSNLNELLNTPIDTTAPEAALIVHPLAIWLEQRIALEFKENALVRRKPMALSEIVQILSNDSGVGLETAEQRIIELLEWINHVNSTQKKSILPYKLHQFISQTGVVYSTLDGDSITLEPNAFINVDGENLPLYSVVFSRISGHEFYVVRKNDATGKLEPREFLQRSEENDDDEESFNDGYLIPGEDVWNPDRDIEQLPDSWLQYRKSGGVTVIKKYRNRIPQLITFDKYGNFKEGDGDLPIKAWFMPSKLLFDPTAGVVYDLKTSERTMLTKLGSEGRSTSTTITTLSILNQLARAGFSRGDQKVLSFTDNRQDAALQSGHFNDFMTVVRLRSAIFRALVDSPNGVHDYSTISQAVAQALQLNEEEYADKPSTWPRQQLENKQALQDYVTYRIFEDLRRGWRVTLPNLEQSGLLKIQYKDLEENCTTEAPWQGIPYFDQLKPSERAELVFQILDYFRRAYAIHSVEYLDGGQLEQKTKAIREKLKKPWTLDDNEHFKQPAYMHYETIAGSVRVFSVSAGYQSALGKYLRDKITAFTGQQLKRDDYINLAAHLFALMEDAGWLKGRQVNSNNSHKTTLYRLNVDKIIWKLVDLDEIEGDPVRIRSYKQYSVKPNLYFKTLYQTDFTVSKDFESSDHTGQVKNEARQLREELFKDGTLSALYCSPTMELGIDIADLRVVHMRNVPPDPSNYAQRGGRAGRSGQAALVYTYCSNYSPHDRHYFHNAKDMVAGVVSPPRIDLANEELLLTHLNALILARKGIHQLEGHIGELVDLDVQDLPLKEEVVRHLDLTDKDEKSIEHLFESVISDFKDTALIHKHWYYPQWILNHVKKFTKSLDIAVNRWRNMYELAVIQRDRAQQVQRSGIYKQNSPEMKTAMRDLNQALRQLDLLKNEHGNSANNEFYPYRYLASEGFLPGYNFTRLPLRAFIPQGDSGEYISRPRFIALGEFGPRNILYYNGAKYRMMQLVQQNIQNNLTSFRAVTSSGYLLNNDEMHLEHCPFTGAPLDNRDDTTILNPVLPMSEARAEQVERISCEEEERVTTGFVKEIFFRVSGSMDTIKTAIIQSDGDELLHVSHIPAAQLMQINRKWRINRDEKFPIGLTTGQWKHGDTSNSKEEVKRVMLYTNDTADALYIEPIAALALEPNGVVTLQYALKIAIENLFNLESREVGSALLGSHNLPNILLYEAAEGSLGVLSQVVEQIDLFPKIVAEAIKLLRYDDKEYQEPASYDDLLSFYNQRDHNIIDRWLIQDALQKLKACTLSIAKGSRGGGSQSYDQRFERLIQQTDPTSDLERTFLKYLYKNNMRLPDAAQKRVPDLYLQPDFYYEPDIWVFIDGKPHDTKSISEADKVKRQALAQKGAQVIVYRYDDDLEELVKTRSDIFTKVR